MIVQYSATRHIYIQPTWAHTFTYPTHTYTYPTHTFSYPAHTHSHTLHTHIHIPSTHTFTCNPREYTYLAVHHQRHPQLGHGGSACMRHAILNKLSPLSPPSDNTYQAAWPTSSPHQASRPTSSLPHAYYTGLQPFPRATEGSVPACARVVNCWQRY